MTGSPSMSADLTLRPNDSDLAAAIRSLPPAHGVYAFVNRTQTLHLSSSRNLQRRLARLLDGRRSTGAYFLDHLQRQDATICCWPTGSALESSLRMYWLARHAFPSDYARRLRLRSPSFLTLTGDTFPRLSITPRASGTGGPILGPFTSREAATRYEEAVESLYQIRRCTDFGQPHPNHPGCIYGEMNLCLRPCQMAVSPEEYSSEVARVAQFLFSDPTASLRQVTSARDRAAEALDFEYAAELHRQREKLSAAVDLRPELSAELTQLSGVVLTTAPQAGTFWLRPVVEGYWHQPALFSLAGEASRNSSLDARLRECTANLHENAREEGDRSEHLALLTRWYYSMSRSGEWFPITRNGDYPIRKLAGALSRLAKAAQSTEPEPAA